MRLDQASLCLFPCRSRVADAIVDTRDRSAFLQAGTGYARLYRGFARYRPACNEVIRATDIIANTSGWR